MKAYDWGVLVLMSYIVGLSWADEAEDIALCRMFMQEKLKQGGVETPDEFNILMDALLSLLVDEWCVKSHGVLESVLVESRTWSGQTTSDWSPPLANK